MLPHFRNKIEKIKTIGSTYMAATGLQPGRGSLGVRQRQKLISNKNLFDSILIFDKRTFLALKMKLRI